MLPIVSKAKCLSMYAWTTGPVCAPLTIVGVRDDDVSEVDAELAAPDGHPGDGVGGEVRRQRQHEVLLVSRRQPGHRRVAVVVELALQM